MALSRIPEVERGESHLLPITHFAPRLPQPQGTYGAVPIFGLAWCPSCHHERVVVAQTLTLADPLDLVMVKCWFACRTCGETIPGREFVSRIHYYEHPWVLGLGES